MKKVVITTTSFAKYDRSPLDFLQKEGFEFSLNSYGRKLKNEEILGLCTDVAGIIAGTENYSEEILKKLPNLRVISRCGTGLDNIDLAAAQRLGIKIYNVPNAPTLAVAELTMALILGLIKKIALMDRWIRNGKWEKMMGRLLYKKKIGIVGFGRIGRKVAELLQPFLCKIRYADPFLENGLLGFTKAPLEKLLPWADIVLLHVSKDEEIIGQKQIQLMKRGAYLLNLSRGKVVNHQALYQALKSELLSGAALDVFEEEPYFGPLRELDNVILTPHVGSYAMEIRQKMEFQAVQNLLKGFKEDK